MINQIKHNQLIYSPTSEPLTKTSLNTTQIYHRNKANLKMVITCLIKYIDVVGSLMPKIYFNASSLFACL